jgi:hypothetical protein
MSAFLFIIAPQFGCSLNSCLYNYLIGLSSEGYHHRYVHPYSLKGAKIYFIFGGPEAWLHVTDFVPECNLRSPKFIFLPHSPGTKERSLVQTGEDSPMANLLLSVMGAFAEFERALIRERQREGIALAKKRGAYRGRKKALPPEQVADLRQRAAAGEQKAALAREFGISPL